MKWNNRGPDRACAKQPLAELIRDELDPKQCARLTAHLDTCETCQQRLTVLAGESSWWLDANRWLDPAVADLDRPDGASELDDFVDDDPHYPTAKEELLASGLLRPSDKGGVLGTLGRYDVQCVIGTGGTGIVLKARDLELSRTVAIKVLSPVLAASGAARRRFAREGQAVAAVAHENVVAVHHVEGAGRLPYLVMQYIDGDSLQDLVARDGPLDVTTALRMMSQLASALSAAHDQGLVHRDVKPANILVGASGQRVWITDFGLARAVDDASLTRTGFIAGTPHYMSPEQARGETVRASSDLFGLGSVLYFVLTGRPPFRAERTLAVLTRICNEPHRPVREVNPNVPHAVADLVDRLLNKSPSGRFPNADAVRAHCLKLLAALTTPDGDPAEIVMAHDRNGSERAGEGAVTRRRQRRQRHPVAWALAVLLLVALGIAGGTYVNHVGWAVLAPSEKTSPLAGRPENVATKPPAPASRPTSPPRPLRRPSTAKGSSAVAPASFPPTAATLPPATTSIAAKPVKPTLQRPTVPAGTVADDEPSLWAADFNELRASFELFDSQIQQPPSGALGTVGTPTPSAFDPFDVELRSMEESLRMLDSAPVAAESAVSPF